MSRFITNSEIMEKFEQIEILKKINKEMDKVDGLQNQIIKDMSFLVYDQAKAYRKFPNYQDLVQEGLIGLLKAVRKFNPSLFPNFFVYSERWIRHSIKRAASRFDVVYCPDKKRVVYAGLAESVDSIALDNPEEEYINKELIQKVRDALNEFSDRDREIVEKVFGLDSSPSPLRKIGSKYNLTHERVRQIKNQVISKLKKNEELIEYTNNND